MRTEYQWSTGKVLYIYFCGAILGANIAWLATTVGARESLLAPIIGVALGVLLPVLPYAQARQARETLSQ